MDVRGCGHEYSSEKVCPCRHARARSNGLSADLHSEHIQPNQSVCRHKGEHLFASVEYQVGTMILCTRVHPLEGKRCRSNTMVLHASGSLLAVAECRTVVKLNKGEHLLAEFECLCMMASVRVDSKGWVLGWLLARVEVGVEGGEPLTDGNRVKGEHLFAKSSGSRTRGSGSDAVHGTHNGGNHI